jgi:hypothetical protein
MHEEALREFLIINCESKHCFLIGCAYNHAILIKHLVNHHTTTPLKVYKNDTNPPDFMYGEPIKASDHQESFILLPSCLLPFLPSIAQSK